MNLDLGAGGNLEVMPGKTIMIGTYKGYSTDSQTEYQRMAKNADFDVLSLEVSAFKHVDNMFNFVRSNKDKPCNFVTMVSDPRMAYTLLQKKWNEEKKELLSKIDQLNKQCKDLAEDTILYSIAIGSMTKYEGSSFIPDYFRDRSLDDPDTALRKSFQKGSELGCINGYHYSYYVNPQLSKDEQVRNELTNQKKLNTQIGGKLLKVVDNNIEKVISKLKERTGCQNPEIIRVPVLFSTNGIDQIPNMTNSVVQSSNNPNTPSKIIIPNPYFKEFSDHLSQKLDEYGIASGFVNDPEYHISYGDVHCGTNTLRICK